MSRCAIGHSQDTDSVMAAAEAVPGGQAAEAAAAGNAAPCYAE